MAVRNAQAKGPGQYCVLEHEPPMVGLNPLQRNDQVLYFTWRYSTKESDFSVLTTSPCGKHCFTSPFAAKNPRYRCYPSRLPEEGADAVEVELTMPRTPCQTFARWVGGEDARGWVKRFADSRRLGAYARVVRTGVVRAGDPITVLSVPDSGPTIADAFRPE